MDPFHSLEKLSDRQTSPISFLPAQQGCAICSSPTHFLTECPDAYQFPEFVYEQTHKAQTQMAYRPGNNTYFNAYDSGWGAQSDFSWEPHPVVSPAPYEPTYVDSFYSDMPYSYYQPSSTSTPFEEKVMQAINRIELYTTELEVQNSQLAAVFSRVEKMELFSQPENNLKGQYLTEDFYVPETYPETLGSEMVIEQPCPTQTTNINNLTRTDIHIEKSEWCGELMPSSSYSFKVPSPSALELPIPINGKGDQIDEMMESEPQLNNTIEEATPTILSSESLTPCMAHFRVDDFDEDGYNIEVNDLLDTPPSCIEKYEPSSSPPIAPVLEPLPTLALQPLPVIPNDTIPVSPNQEAQLVGVLTAHKEAIGWDISIMKDNDLKTFMNDFSILGTTFEDCLQNFSTLLKQCTEADLVLIWNKCLVKGQDGMVLCHIVSELGCVRDEAKIELTFMLPHPTSAQQTQALPDNNYGSNKLLATNTLFVRVSRRRILYGYFSAMVTRPPDWPCPFTILRDALKMITTKTLS